MSIKKIVFFGFIIFSFFVINDSLHSIYSLWQKYDMLDHARRSLSVEKKRNSEFKQQLDLVNAPHFIEEQARNKLFLVKPGEGIVVLAPTEYPSASSPALIKSIIDKRANWQKWWDVFF
jgi:cell division protein FtsB